MAAIEEIGEGLYCLDLAFQGLPGVIAAYLLEGDGEYALIETGPTTTLATLLSSLRHLGIDPATLTTLLVTHIHLDHAGAAGQLIQRYPHLRLAVHEVGAPHMIDPTRLLRSATRIYGDRMEALWGEVTPVPAANVTVLTGDATAVTVGGRTLRVLYTPGHASHHVAYVDDRRGEIFTGDVAGVRLQGFHTIRPPCPPPDIDLARWRASLDLLEGLHPARLLLTHFGPHDDVAGHLAEMRARLTAWTERVRESWKAGAGRDRIVADLTAFAARDIAGSDDPSAATRYELATPTEMSADGLIRYFRTHETSGTS